MGRYAFDSCQNTVFLRYIVIEVVRSSISIIYIDTILLKIAESENILGRLGDQKWTFYYRTA